MEKEEESKIEVSINGGASLIILIVLTLVLCFGIVIGVALYSTLLNTIQKDMQMKKREDRIGLIYNNMETIDNHPGEYQVSIDNYWIGVISNDKERGGTAA